MRRLDYFLAGLGGALMVALFYLLSPAVLEAVQYPAVRLTDNSGNYIGSVANPIAVSGGGFFNATGGTVIQSSGGTLPTATCSGGSTGVVVASGSTNNRGSFVSSSVASTTCTLTFSPSGTWNQAPFCNFFDQNGSITPFGVSASPCSTSSCQANFISMTSKVIGYTCM